METRNIIQSISESLQSTLMESRNTYPLALDNFEVRYGLIHKIDNDECINKTRISLIGQTVELSPTRPSFSERIVISVTMQRVIEATFETGEFMNVFGQLLDMQAAVRRLFYRNTWIKGLEYRSMDVIEYDYENAMNGCFVGCFLVNYERKLGLQ